MMDVLIAVILGLLVGGCFTVGWLLWHPDRLDQLIRFVGSLRDAWGRKP